MSKINFIASNNPYIFQFFKLFIHQNEKNEFYYDGSLVEDNPGVMVDFTNIEHSYEVIRLLGNYWGGWDSTPTSSRMSKIAKLWYEKYDAELTGISFDTLTFSCKRMTETEAQKLMEEVTQLSAMIIDCEEEELLSHLMEKQTFTLWWD